VSILDKSLADQVRSAGNQPEPADKSNSAPLNNRSYVRGRSDIPLHHITINELLRDTIAQFGSREALVFSVTGERYSYYDFDREIEALATGFLAMGLLKGDRVGIWSPNRFEWVLTQFATARIGVILVNVNPAYRLTELDYALNKVGCKALVLAPSFKSSNYIEMINELAPELADCAPGKLASARLKTLNSVIVMGDEPVAGTYKFDELKDLGGPAQRARLPLVESSLSPDDAINIQFTSGTTGAPKGATLSHYNIVNNARFVTDRINLTENDRLCIPVPLYHCFGMVMGVLGAVSKGAAMVFPAEAFDVTTTMNALTEERCTAIYGVPTMFVGLLHEVAKSPGDLSALRTGIMAGAPCPVEVMEQVNSAMNLSEITICYGMTETAPVSFQSDVDDPTDKRCETVGRIHPHVEVKVIDNSGTIVPVNHQGELCTRGYSVMKGYWADDERTRESIVEGWMHTGDLAVIDEQGYCSIVGRVKDMIIRGGENIYPRGIEEFLYGHPKIAGAQVFGVPDKTYGEIVCAWVLPKPDEQLSEAEIRGYCQGQIAHYKIPKYVRVVDDIPMTITGKPQKFVMRDRMIEILEGEQKFTPTST